MVTDGQNQLAGLGTFIQQLSGDGVETAIPRGQQVSVLEINCGRSHKVIRGDVFVEHCQTQLFELVGYWQGVLLHPYRRLSCFLLNGGSNLARTQLNFHIGIHFANEFGIAGQRRLLNSHVKQSSLEIVIVLELEGQHTCLTSLKLLGLIVSVDEVHLNVVFGVGHTY
mgnify:FL=1